MTWAPAEPRLDRWLELYHQVTARNGAEADAGRHLLGWAQAAGFAYIEVSSSTWTYADPEDRAWWGGLWADRVGLAGLRPGRPGRRVRPVHRPTSWPTWPRAGGPGPRRTTASSSSSTSRCWPGASPRRHPVAVEAEGHPLGEVDRGHGVAGEVVGGQDHQVAAVGRGVVDVGQSQPSSSPASADAGHEDQLVGDPARAVRRGARWCPSARSYFTAAAVVLGAAELHGVAVAVGPTERGARRAGAARRRCRRGSPPTTLPAAGSMVQRSRRVGPSVGPRRSWSNIFGWRTTSTHDPAGLVLVGVEGVEHVAEADLEPPDVVGLALPGQEADPGAVVGVPARRGTGSRPSPRRGRR